MKTLQTTQKRPYTSPFIEVLEAENDMTILTTSINGQARRNDFIDDENYSGTEDGFKE